MGAPNRLPCMTNDEIRGVIRSAIAAIKHQAAGGMIPQPERLVAKLEQALVTLRMSKAQKEVDAGKKD
jgi:hypothetical protein